MAYSRNMSSISKVAICHFCQDKKNTLRRRSWLLLFLDRVWPPRSSALCFLVQKEVEREKKKSQKTSFLGITKFLTRSVFHKLLLCFHKKTFLFTDFLLLHCFPRQIVVGYIKNKPKNFFRDVKFLTRLYRFFSFTDFFLLSLHKFSLFHFIFSVRCD